MKLNKISIALVSAAMALAGCGNSSVQEEKMTNEDGYLFAYFIGNGEGQEQIFYALSEDGYHYTALNDGEPIIDSATISQSGGVRDPHLLRGPDGYFYMVVTDLKVDDMGWNNTAMVLMKSPDLINWQHSDVNIVRSFPDKFGDVNRVWAPQTIYDKSNGKMMVYFSMKQGHGPDIIYYAYANSDFTALESEPKQLYFPPSDAGNTAAIDGDIVEKDGKFYLFHKAEDGDPGIKLAVADSLTGDYKLVSKERIDKQTAPVEGSGVFKLNDSDEYILMYDLYTQGGYEFAKSTDLTDFTVIDEEIHMNFHPRHGSVLSINNKEMRRLLSKWGTFSGSLDIALSDHIRTQNILVDDTKQTAYLPVKLGTKLNHFDPVFAPAAGATISPTGAQDFSHGPVEYTITLQGEKKTYSVAVEEANNPVVDGYYADPEIIYSHKNQKYYLYPTSDGFHGWSGKHFETFSSPDLVNWTPEGTILDLVTDVSWADRNAWAPTAIETKIDGQYKYFYYFTAAQKIGVGVADEPTGPFIDSGKPLIDFRPEGIEWGQEIDPDVFRDPVSGKHYLYWGNGYMAGIELNPDMMSVDKSTLTVMTPDSTFREGAEVFYRDGLYYFLWSENDTRDADYRVRYATAESPLGPLTIPENNLVIAKNETLRILATGHNSVINKPNSDEWFIVYHRFTRPEGETMGGDAGFHREVCIDKLTFDKDGNIIVVQPTLTGITKAP